VKTIIIKNTTLSDIELLSIGETVPAGVGSPVTPGIIDLSVYTSVDLRSDSVLLSGIASGNLVVNDGIQDITNIIQGKDYIIHDVSNDSDDGFWLSSRRRFSIKFTQTAHGFMKGNVVKFDNITNTLILATADNIANSSSAAIVQEVIDVDNIYIMVGAGGTIVNVNPIIVESGLALITGQIYFLSTKIAGKITEIAPTGAGEVMKVMGFATSSTEFLVLNYPPRLNETAISSSDISILTAGNGGYDVGTNTNWKRNVLSRVVTDPSILTPSNGDRYIVAPSAIGVWTGLDNRIVEYRSSTSDWIDYVPELAWVVFDNNASEFNFYNGSIWIQAAKWSNIIADSGSTTPDIPQDTLTISGGTGITTSITGDILTIASSVPVGDLASACVSRTTTFNLPLTYTDVTWNTTDIETDPAVIEHNNTNTDNIDIKETGLYLITYSLSIDADPGEETFDFRVRLNDTSVLPCSERTISEDDEINAVSCVFPANLTAGDFITLQVRASGNGNVFSLGHNFTVIRMQGTKGADGIAGPPGSGSSIIVKEEGVNLTNTPHTELNFVGTDITALDAGLGVADITFSPIFGSEYQHAESLTVTTTTSTAFLNKVTMVTPSLPAGTYRIEVSYGWNHNANGNDFEARVREDAVNIGEIHKQEPKDSAGSFSTTGSSQRYLAHRVYYRTLTAGVKTYTLDFRTDSAGTNSSMWDAGITIFRVA